MNFTVSYSKDAEDQLAEAWLAATDRSVITAAQNHIDQLLSRDPKAHGREIIEDLWRIVVPPLVALFEIDDSQREVTVTGFALLR